VLGFEWGWKAFGKLKTETAVRAVKPQISGDQTAFYSSVFYILDRYLIVEVDKNLGAF
jgi:hypothetical protein